MKIQIIRIGRQPTWELTQLIEEAATRRHSISIEDFASLNDISQFNDNGTDAFIYRSTSLQSPLAKATILNSLQAKVILNQAQRNLPFAAYKSYQFHTLSRHTSVPIIPTYQFQKVSQLKQAISDQTLSYPFVQKINFGGKGFDVNLIKKPSELTISDHRIPEYIYQNFVPNNHDFRVFTVGGQVLAIIKRTAPPDDFRNNVSLGGAANQVTDISLINQMIVLSDQVISCFPLHIMGIDFIQHSVTGELQLLEINTVPQWQGVQTQTKVNIAAHVIDLCESLAASPARRLSAIRQTYLDHLNSLTSYQRVHFVSRLALFDILPDLKYLPTPAQMSQAFFDQPKPDISKFYQSPPPDLSAKKFSAHRQDLLSNNYPHLLNIHRLFEWASISDSLHHQNKLPDIKAALDKNQLTEYYQPLMDNPDHVLKLSSIAINYLYFLANANLLDAKSAINLDYIADLMARDAKSPASLEPELIIYLITHAFIGESKWYQNLHLPLTDTSQQLITDAENLITQNFFQLSLDCKLEFLVVCRLLNYSSPLKPQIMSEAANSLSDLDNFIIDRRNTSNHNSRRSFNASEHRNVLYCILQHYAPN